MSEEKIVVHIDIDLEDLIPGFLDNRQKDIRNLESALQENDFETLRSIGHNLKGVGGGYGFSGITEMGAEIERGAKASDPESVSVNVKKLSHYLSSVEIIYEEV
ncbi:MAG: Hpt domain-containing protein [Proteobacteria bacterium]|nr:Hpt domain-containing protein [Pseudomonadota bacterium]